MLSQQYGHSEAYMYRVWKGDIISDILLHFVNAFSHSNMKISCSDLSYTIEHSHMKGDLRLNHYLYKWPGQECELVADKRRHLSARGCQRCHARRRECETGTPSKHDTFTQCWYNVVSASHTVAQQCTSFGRTSLVCY